MRQLLIGTMILTMTGGVLAQEDKRDPESVMKLIAPLIDEQTVMVAHIDFTRFDVKPLFDIAGMMAQPPQEPAQEAKAAVEQTLKMLRDGGLRDIFVLYSTADFMRPPVVAIPAEQTRGIPEPLQQKTARGLSVESARVKGFLVFASPSSIERLKSITPIARPAFAQAMTEAGDAPIVGVFTISPDIRRVFEEISTELPQEVGGGSIRVITRDMKWVTITVNTEGDVPIRLTAQFANEGAPQAVKATIGNLFKWIGNFPSEPTGKTTRERYGKVHDRLVEVLTPKVEGNQLIIEVAAKSTLIEITKLMRENPLIGHFRESQTNLKQIALAVHNYYDTHRKLPANIVDKDGKPLLSWRVYLLPYLEQANLYEQFKLDEPWDSEHNKKLIAKMPDVFRAPAQNPKLKGKTTYLAPVGPKTVFPGGEIKFPDIQDGTSQTIMVLEANDDQAVTWTKPDDLPVGKPKLKDRLIGHYDDGFLAVLCDGSVHFFKDLDEKTLIALLTRNGGEIINWP